MKSKIILGGGLAFLLLFTTMANATIIANDLFTHQTERVYNHSVSFLLEQYQYQDIYFNFTAQGNYGKDWDEEGIQFSLDGKSIGAFGIGHPDPQKDYYSSLTPDVGTLVSFMYTEQIPQQHYTMIGSINLDEFFFNSLLSDNVLTVSWQDDFGTRHIIGDQYDELVQWELSAAPVPEPSTLLLLSGGLVGVFWYNRKRNSG